jgi:O-antigen/teichoic acid export membrane protein
MAVIVIGVTGQPEPDGSVPAANPARASRLTSLREHLNAPLFRNAYALVVNTGITAVLGFVYWVVAARLFTTTDVGLAAAAISAMTLLAGISLLNMEAVLVRFIPIAGRQTRRLVLAVFAGCSVLAVISSIIFIIGLPVWTPSLDFLVTHFNGLGFIGATLAWSYFILLDGILVGLGRAVWVPVENALFGVAKLAFLLAFVGERSYGIFASWSLAAALVVIPFALLILLRFIPAHMEKTVPGGAELTRETFRSYAAGDYVGSVFELAAISLLPIVVTHWAGAEENAYFYQSWIIAYTLILVANNTARALTVEAARDASQLHRYGRVVLKHTLKLLIPLVVGVVILAPWILSVFGTAYAAEGTLTLRILALAALPHTVILLGLVTARLQHQLKTVIAIQGVIATVTLGTAVTLVERMGSLGAAVGWFSAQLIVALVLLATYLRWLFQGDATPQTVAP